MSLVVKQGDLFPPVQSQVKDETGALVVVTNATVKFSMRDSRNPSTIKVNLANGTVVDGPNGKIQYQWAGTDTNTPGTYEGEFLVTPQSGNAFKVPTDGYIEIAIESKVA